MSKSPKFPVLLQQDFRQFLGKHQRPWYAVNRQIYQGLNMFMMHNVVSAYMHDAELHEPLSA